VTKPGDAVVIESPSFLARHEVPLIEDDVYGELYQGDTAPPTMSAFVCHVSATAGSSSPDRHDRSSPRSAFLCSVARVAAYQHAKKARVPGATRPPPIIARGGLRPSSQTRPPNSP